MSDMAVGFIHSNDGGDMSGGVVWCGVVRELNMLRLLVAAMEQLTS